MSGRCRLGLESRDILIGSQQGCKAGQIEEKWFATLRVKRTREKEEQELRSENEKGTEQWWQY